MNELDLTVISKASHRNGVGGAPFKVALVRDSTNQRTMLVTMFEKSGHTAVVDVDHAAMGDIAFGSNSWRGDHYEEALRTELWPSDEEYDSSEWATAPAE